MIRISFLSLLLVATACGGASKSGTTPSFLKVEDAALPYRIVSAQDGREVSQTDFYAQLKTAQAVCVGESHTDSHHHWAQLEVLRHLSGTAEGSSKTAEGSGKTAEGSGTSAEGSWAIGMEMFQRPFQGVLDDFSEGQISEKELLSGTGYEERWRHDWRFYAPMVRFAVQGGAALLALNISKELKEKWKDTGLEGLSEEDKAKIPEVKLDVAEHQQWFRSLMESMSEDHGEEGSEGESEAEPVAETEAEPAAEAEPAPEAEPEPDFIDSIYPVQVLWDETMADTASKWLQAGEGRKLVVLAGNGHCHNSAIVGRMKRRGISTVLSVRPVVDSGDGELADLLASPINDYIFVMTAKE